MNWVKDFEETFKISDKESPDYWRIIIGQEKYRQQVGPTPLKSPRPNRYGSIGDVAFLVNEWIKIQDSLEMIFQLLCYTPYHDYSNAKPLEILGYLRKNKISSQDFADYLYDSHKVILINKCDFSSLKQHLQGNLCGSSPNRVLFVGSQAGRLFDNSFFRTFIKGHILHPSGVNLNLNNGDYYQSWYLLTDTSLKKYDAQFSLSDFKIF